MYHLDGKIALITGAGAGIGRSIALRLADEGCDVGIVDLDAAGAEVTAELVRGKGPRAAVAHADVAVRDQVAVAVEAVTATLGPVDILVNNAGILRVGGLLEIGPEAWQDSFRVNADGPFNCCRAVVPGMVQRGRGHVVNLGSIAGRQTYPRGNVYCATKAAVRALTEGLKQDLLGTPIRVSSVDPGLVETEFSEVRFHGDHLRAAEVYQGLTPLSPMDIAEIVLFCITRPAHVNVSELLVVPTDQSSATLVHRRS